MPRFCPTNTLSNKITIMQKKKVDGEWLRRELERLMPECSLDEDNEGQVVIYTNLVETTDGDYKVMS